MYIQLQQIVHIRVIFTCSVAFSPRKKCVDVAPDCEDTIDLCDNLTFRNLMRKQLVFKRLFLPTFHSSPKNHFRSTRSTDSLEEYQGFFHRVYISMFSCVREHAVFVRDLRCSHDSERFFFLHIYRKNSRVGIISIRHNISEGNTSGD